MSPVLDLTEVVPRAYYTWPEPDSPAFSEEIRGTVQQVPDHGLFVAGLAHHVAQDSQILLYPVLDRWARGDLFTLNASLLDFVEKQFLVREEELDGAVINLSLGINSPRELIDLGLVDFDQEHWDSIGFHEQVLKEMPSIVRSLEMLLGGALCAGITVTAAAGNGSSPFAQIPARWPGVVGVASSNFEGERSCFSNPGDIAAPGGEGDQAAGKECQPMFDKADVDHTLYGLLGPVLHGDHPSGSYAYWAGTSFSTPLVSGLAALLLDKCPGTAGVLLFSEVQEEPNTSGLGTGIIDVAASMTATCPEPDP
jgi:hypothetical protein